MQLLGKAPFVRFMDVQEPKTLLAPMASKYLNLETTQRLAVSLLHRGYDGRCITFVASNSGCRIHFRSRPAVGLKVPCKK